MAPVVTPAGSFERSLDAAIAIGCADAGDLAGLCWLFGFLPPRLAYDQHRSGDVHLGAPGVRGADVVVPGPALSPGCRRGWKLGVGAGAVCLCGGPVVRLHRLANRLGGPVVVCC